jgi:hypothetical protein
VGCVPRRMADRLVRAVAPDIGRGADAPGRAPARRERLCRGGERARRRRGAALPVEPAACSRPMARRWPGGRARAALLAPARRWRRSPMSAALYPRRIPDPLGRTLAN